MSFERQFSLASHALALVGVFALTLTGEVAAPFALFALFAVSWSGWSGWSGGGVEIDARLANALTLGVLGYLGFLVVAGGRSPIQGIAEFLLVLQGLKALAPKAPRDWVQLYMLSFFQLLAAAALTVELAFAVVFLSYLVLAPWVLTLFHLRREAPASGGLTRLGEDAFVDPSLFSGVVGVTFVLFLSTVAVFLVFPRVGAGFFANPLSTGTGLTGFTDEVGLGDVSALETDESVVMRVVVTPPERAVPGQRYWRGAILDHFDGRRWSRGRHRFEELPTVERGVYAMPERARSADVVHEEFILEPIEIPALLHLGRVMEVRGSLGSVMADPLGNLRASFAGGRRIAYEVEAAMDGDHTLPAGDAVALPPGLDPRLPALAAELGRDQSEARDRVHAILRFFARGFSYTLEPGSPGKEDPLARFLFETKSGHCEYYASALAVLLRGAGVPARVVNGFAGGEWNEFGGYWLVRQSDAHSWVEAWVDGAWRTLDATPAVAPRAAPFFGRLASMVDAARVRWYRYVVNYSVADQVSIAFAVRDGSRWLRDELTLAGLKRRLAIGTFAGIDFRWLAIGALAGVGALLLLARRRSTRAAASMDRATVLYLRLLRLLEKRGIRRPPSATADELARAAGFVLGESGELVRRAVELYEVARFSGREAAAAAANEATQEILVQLEARLSTPAWTALTADHGRRPAVPRTAR